jgi:hypothetical protein
MKILVVGGTSGFGRDIVEQFKADGIGKQSGHALPEHMDEVVSLSLQYNCVINCVSDYSQNAVAYKMYEAHDALNLSTYFITIGSMTWRIETANEGKRQLFDWAESLITRNTKLKHTLLNPAWMYNTKEQGLFEKIPKEEILATIKFLLSTCHFKSKLHIVEIQGTPYTK